MKAVAILEKGKTGLVEIPKPVPGEYDCLVEIETCGFCNATDMKLIDNVHSREMIEYPAVLGHEGAGRIISAGKKVKYFEVGDSVISPGQQTPAPNAGYSLKYGAMAEYGLITDYAAMIDDGLTGCQNPQSAPARKIPSSINMNDAALILSVKEIYKALINFGLAAGMDVLIYGDGPIGFGLCYFSELAGAGSTVCIGHRAERLAKIRSAGCRTQLINAYTDDINMSLSGKRFDLVIDAVGQSAIMREGAQRLKPGGKIALYGVLSPQDSVIDLLDFPNHIVLHLQSFPYREHDCHDEIINKILSGEINLKHFYSHILPAAEIQKIVDMTRSREAYKIVINMKDI